jgi:hypothetical protein
MRRITATLLALLAAACAAPPPSPPAPPAPPASPEPVPSPAPPPAPAGGWTRLAEIAPQATVTSLSASGRRIAHIARVPSSSGGELWVSEDGGTHFGRVRTAADVQDGYLLRAVVVGTGTEYVLMTIHSMTFQGCAMWRRTDDASLCCLGRPVEALAFSPGDPNLVLGVECPTVGFTGPDTYQAGDPPGRRLAPVPRLVRSRDGGQTFEDVGPPKAPKAVAFAGGGAVALLEDGVYASADGGTTWARTGPPPPRDLPPLAWFFDDAGELAAIDGCRIVRPGRAPIDLPDPGRDPSRPGCGFRVAVAGARLYASGAAGVFESDGARFAPIAPAPEGAAITATAADAGVLYAAAGHAILRFDRTKSGRPGNAGQRAP